jgi:hypothetical protein
MIPDTESGIAPGAAIGLGMSAHCRNTSLWMIMESSVLRKFTGTTLVPLRWFSACRRIVGASR